MKSGVWLKRTTSIITAGMIFYLLQLILYLSRYGYSLSPMEVLDLINYGARILRRRAGKRPRGGVFNQLLAPAEGF